MPRILLALAVCLAVLGLAGCDPFETEVTLNADGSGRVVYKGQLSNGARLMVREGLRPNSPLRALFARDAAMEWNKANADSGVRVVGVSEELDKDKLIRLRAEVTFDSLEKLSRTTWGYLLQMGVDARDGRLLLQFDDPMRVAVNRLALREFSDDGTRNDRRQTEYAALVEALATGLKGQASRVTWVLPGPALGVTGAVLSPDMKRVTLENVVGEGEAELNAWLGRTATVVTLPAGFAGLKDFPQRTVPPYLPEAGVRPAPAVGPTPAPAPPAAAEGFRVQVSSISYTSNRTLSIGDGDLTPFVNETLRVQLQLYGPAQPPLLSPPGFRAGGEPSVCNVTMAVDSAGRDLRNPDAQPNVSIGSTFERAYRRSANEPLGSVQLSLRSPAAGAKSIARLEGTLSLIQVVEEGVTEIKPLKDNLGKEFVLGRQTIKFSSVAGKAVEYVLSAGDYPVALKFFTSDGKEVTSDSYSSSGGSWSSMTVNRTLSGPIGDGGYVVVRYPVKTQQVKVPFSRADIRIP